MPVNKPLDPEFVKSVLELAKQMNGHQIAKHLNSDKNRVWYVLKKYKVTPKRTHHRPLNEVLEIVRYAKLHKQRKTLEKFGITKNQLNRCYIRYRKIEKKFIDREPQLRRAAISHAIVKANCLKETAEEFASYCVQKYITNDKGVFFDTAFADFMRERLGRTGTASSEAEKNTVPLSDYDESFTPQTESAYSLLPKTLNGLLTVLVYKYGFTKRELATYLGTTEAAVGQRVNRTLERMREKHGRDLETNT